MIGNLFMKFVFFFKIHFMSLSHFKTLKTINLLINVIHVYKSVGLKMCL